MEMHKHKGVVRSDGTLRSHPVSQAHKDAQVYKWHTAVLPKVKAKKTLFSKPQSTPKPQQPIHGRTITLPMDGEYIYADLASTNARGIKIKFQRREGNKRRTVGLQIEKNG